MQMSKKLSNQTSRMGQSCVRGRNNDVMGCDVKGGVYHSYMATVIMAVQCRNDMRWFA